MAYRDDASAHAARCAALALEVDALEADLEKQRVARATIQATDRESRPGVRYALNRPGMILALLLALGAGVYVGHAFHVEDEYVGGPCADPTTTENAP